MQTFQAKEAFKIVKFFGMLNDTPEYQYLRQNFMVALKQRGNGLQHLEETTILYVKELLGKMEAEGGFAFDPKNMIEATLSKLMMTLTYGFDGEKELKRISEAEEQKNDLFSEIGPCMILNFCPPLRFIVPSLRKTYNQLLCQVNAYYNVFKELTNKRRCSFEGRNPKIYIDHFLHLIGKPKVRPGITKHALPLLCF